jgi:chemotaxis protein CheD
MPRRVIYLPSTGKVLVKHLRTLESRAIATREQQYLTSFKQKPVENDVELF